MRIINKKYLLIILLVGVLLTGVFLFKANKEVKLDNVILKQEVNNKTFAMYKEYGENNYVPVEGTDFPKGYYLNITESKCIDNNGNKLEGVLSYENNEVTITSGNTTYCYLYFDKSMGIKLVENNPDVITSQLMSELYRYHGLEVDNYICFGASKMKDCTDNPDKYMYRIVGITEEGSLKVIKNAYVGDTFQWNTVNEIIPFEDSLIFKYLSSDLFSTNDLYLDSNWQDKIENRYWNVGSAPDYQIYPYGETIFNQEKSEQSSNMFKYGLLYLTDFLYAYDAGDGTTLCDHDNSCPSWLDFVASDNHNAFTMIRDGDNSIWAIYNYNGLKVSGISHNENKGRLYPVFYINNMVQLKDGSGTIENPFIIA